MLLALTEARLAPSLSPNPSRLLQPQDQGLRSQGLAQVSPREVRLEPSFELPPARKLSEVPVCKEPPTLRGLRWEGKGSLGDW